MNRLFTDPASLPGGVAAPCKPKMWPAWVLFGACVAVATPVFASQTTLQRIEIMRDNGTITQAQYARLKAAAAHEAQHKSGAARPTRQSPEKVKARPSTPRLTGNIAPNDKFAQMNKQLATMAWAAKIKLKGDIRLRYEYSDLDSRVNDNGDQVDRHRGRVRYRLGIIAKPIDHVKVGAGLASGGNDPRSTNQTFTNTFSSKGIQLDYAYAQYAYKDVFKAVGGKFDFDDYLWQPTDLTWDGDIRPEGASANYNFNGPAGRTFVNSGIWVLNQFSSDSNDPFVYYGQLGQAFSSGNLYGKLAATYYGYQHTGQTNAFDPRFSAGTNTDNQFKVFDASATLGTHIFGDRGKIGVVGQYVHNIETNSSADTGYALGLKGGLDQWSFKYVYANLDANAVPDSFPDSDRLGGATDVRAHEVALAYALVDHVELGLDYYHSERKATRNDENLLQTDLVVSF